MTDMIKKIKNIIDKSNTDKIVIFTNRLKIVGHIYNCDECNNDYFLNLTNAIVIYLNDLYPCEDKGDCEEYPSQNFDWLHVNIDKILAFSLVK